MARKLAALLAGVLLGFAPHTRAASPERPGLEIRDEARRQHLIEQIRIADADRLMEQPDEIAAYLSAHFNTVVLYDNRDAAGSLKSEEQIAHEVGFARDHQLHILIGKSTEPASDDASGGRASDQEIRDRLTLWDNYGHDLILGVFFLHDDACSMHAGVERQLHLYEIAHETVPDWHVFGMIGGPCNDLPLDEALRYFDPNAFDDLIVLMYPLAASEVREARLRLTTSSDYDQEMQDYVRRYVEKMGAKFFSLLRPGQTVLLVIQAYAYEGETAANIPRPEDVDIQATVGMQTLETFAGQTENRSIAYFLWDGSRAGIVGLRQRPDWMSAAEVANGRIEKVPTPVDRRPAP